MNIPSRIFIWRTSTGALVNEWALETPATAPPEDPEGLLPYIACAVFSRDSTRVLTLRDQSDHFAVWSVPDGQLIAVNRGAPGGDSYLCADFGVPGSASEGLVGFGSATTADVDLWDVPPQSARGQDSRPRLRNRVSLVPADDVSDGAFGSSFKFSPDGSKFAASFYGTAYVYDVASLARLGVYDPMPADAVVAWTPSGQHVLVSWHPHDGACVWDLSLQEAPSVDQIPDLGPDMRFCCWAPSGVSCFLAQGDWGEDGSATYALEERRVADGSFLRAADLGPLPGFPSKVIMSPDAQAALICHWIEDVPPRVVVLDWRY